jgi:hypothetical protein
MPVGSSYPPAQNARDKLLYNGVKPCKPGVNGVAHQVTIGNGAVGVRKKGESPTYAEGHFTCTDWSPEDQLTMSRAPALRVFLD